MLCDAQHSQFEGAFDHHSHDGAAVRESALRSARVSWPRRWTGPQVSIARTSFLQQSTLAIDSPFGETYGRFERRGRETRAERGAVQSAAGGTISFHNWAGAKRDK